MKKTISGISLLLATLPVWAQEKAEVPIPSAADADPTALIVCAVIFLVLIGIFFGYVWMRERNNKSDGK